MLVLTMWFGILWPSIVPLVVAPGMTEKQVEALLGKPPELRQFIFTGSVNRDTWTREYPNWSLTVCYEGMKVVKVERYQK